MRAGSSPRLARSPPGAARAAESARRMALASRRSSVAVVGPAAGVPPEPRGVPEILSSPPARPVGSPLAGRAGGDDATRARSFPATLATCRSPRLFRAPPSSSSRAPALAYGRPAARSAGASLAPVVRRGPIPRRQRQSSARPPRRVARDDRRSPPTPAARGSSDLPDADARAPDPAVRVSNRSLSPGRPCLYTAPRHYVWPGSDGKGQPSRGSSKEPEIPGSIPGRGSFPKKFPDSIAEMSVFSSSPRETRYSFA